MKILMMTNTYTPVVGGVEESIKAFTGQFQREGHEVLIVAPEFANMPEHEENIIRIPAIQKFNRSDFSVNLPIPGLLSKLVNKFKPDIVHSHHPFLIGDMALRLCGQYDIPLVFTYHTMFEDYLHYLPFHNERIKRFVIELATGYANLTDHVIVPSQSVHNILSERGVDVPMSIIPTGIDIDRFSRGDGGRIRTKYGIPGNAFVIGHLGRLRTEKNLNFLSDAVAGFIKQNNNCHFLVIGGGPEETGIRRIFEKNGISECLHMTGVLQGQDVVDGYHAMNVFAFASHTETQGLVLTETLVSGIPVVALDAPGVREVVRDKKNGRLIPRQERNDFINALSWCYHCNEMQFDSLKIECRKIAGDFSIENCARKELDIYRSVSASNSMLSDQKHSAWSGIMHRIKTEWDMAKNFAEASEAAFHLQEGSEIKSRSARLEKRHSKSRVIRWKRWLSRHEWAARLLNLKRSKATEAHNGLVLIQVDGFSRRQFQKALDTGEMPFLKRLLDSQHYKNYPLYTGLPSSTPSVQGELFYGVQQSVPAFAFYDGKCDRVFRMYDRLAVVEIEGRLNERTSNDKKGDASRLLSGGSSYSNVYSGGAGESHFCAVKIGWDMFWRGVNPLRITLLWITHILDFLWIIALMAAETIASVFDFTLGLCSGRNFWKELKFIPTRVFICVLLRELVIMGVKMDISRGHEIIHMNFLGYDEQAHRRGPSSVFAHKALRGIDNSIAKIYWHAFHSTRRNYDVWIYSDHGQEDSDSYVEKLGITVKKAIEKVYKKFDGGNSARTEDDRIIANAVQDDDHQGVQTHRTRYLGDWFTRWLFSLIGVTYETDELRNKGMGEGVIVTAIGPTGNIYLPRKLQNEERDRFARSLVANAGIPAVLSPDGPGQVSVWNKNGQFRLPEHAREIIGGDHMYLEEITEDLIRLCHHSQGGDFTFLGWSPGDTPLTFPIESGAHAGPGKEETNAFALLPCDIVSSLDEPAFLRTRDLRQSALKFLGRMDPKEPGPAPMPVSLPTRETAPASRTLRVMTYNVHSCIGMDGKISPERIARLIGRHHPDVVALQELDLMRARTGGEDQPHIIAKELEMMYHFHPNMIVEEEHYGNAILSRYPVELVKTVQLPGLLHKPDLEPRGAMWCCIDLGGVKLQLINTHLGLRSAERLRQVRMLCGSQWLEHPRCTGPVILCGDFNALPGSPVCRQIRRKLRDAQFEMKDHSPRATWFSRYPVGRIDHVFVSPEIEVTNVVVSQTDLDKKYSDHLPLIIDISFSSRILQNTTSTNETHS